MFGVNPTVHPICDARPTAGEKDLLSLEFIWNQASPNSPSLTVIYRIKGMDCDLHRSSVFGVNPTVHPICDARPTAGEKDLLSLEFIWNQASPNSPSLTVIYRIKGMDCD